MEIAFGILAGLVVGAVVATAVTLWRRRQEAELRQRQIDETDRRKAEELSGVIDQLKTAFDALSRDALSRNTDDFLKLAKTRFEQQSVESEKSLEAKKTLIDARLEEMGAKLQTLNNLIHAIEKQRAEAHGTLKGHIEKATQATNRLHETTAQLREALANPQARGQWGERMAEDVLRLAGFVEGINYVKQQQAVEGTRPDFTFHLPGNRKVNMDVKFPLANYLKMLDSSDDAARQASAARFLKDVRARVKEVTTRDYIDPAAGTVDYCLVFIPNEQVYGFIHQQDSGLLDEAMRCKVVLCSPMTLYAILAVIRQAMDNFRLEENSKQVLELLAGVQKQWGKYVESMDAMGARLEAAMAKYQELVGVRTRQLDRQLDKIDDLRAARQEQVVSDAGPSAPHELPSENVV